MPGIWVLIPWPTNGEAEASAVVLKYSGEDIGESLPDINPAVRDFEGIGGHVPPADGGDHLSGEGEPTDMESIHHLFRDVNF